MIWVLLKYIIKKNNVAEGISITNYNYKLSIIKVIYLRYLFPLYLNYSYLYFTKNYTYSNAILINILYFTNYKIITLLSRLIFIKKNTNIISYKFKHRFRRFYRLNLYNI